VGAQSRLLAGGGQPAAGGGAGALERAVHRASGGTELGYYLGGRKADDLA
jgi:hypothetical protein